MSLFAAPGLRHSRGQYLNLVVIHSPTTLLSLVRLQGKITCTLLKKISMVVCLALPAARAKPVSGQHHDMTLFCNVNSDDAHCLGCFVDSYQLYYRNKYQLARHYFYSNPEMLTHIFTTLLWGKIQSE